VTGAAKPPAVGTTEISACQRVVGVREGGTRGGGVKSKVRTRRVGKPPHEKLIHGTN